MLIIAGVLTLLVAGCVGAGFYWWSQNRDALVARGKAVVESGRTAGRLTDNKGCVDQSITRYKAGPGFTSGISTGIFIQSCLKSSRPTAGFCDDVPKMTEFIRQGQWQRLQCQSVGLGSDPFCPSIFQGVERFCAEDYGETSLRRGSK